MCTLSGADEDGSDAMPCTTLTVPAMDCRHAVRLVTARLRDLPGVETVEADPRSSTLVVQGEVPERTVRSVLAAAGFPAQPAVS